VLYINAGGETIIASIFGEDFVQVSVGKSLEKANIHAIKGLPIVFNYFCP